jgi:hypothetical protein
MDKSERAEVWEELVSFVASRTGFRKTDILSRRFTLNRDIGVDGDDADEFMEEYFDHFGVDVGDYDWSRYFGEEGFNPLSVLIDLVKRKPAPRLLTLGMLELAATMGRWDTEALERASSKDTA